MARKKKLNRKHMTLLTATATLSNLFPYAVLATEPTASLDSSIVDSSDTPIKDSLLTYDELSTGQQDILKNVKNTYDTVKIKTTGAKAETLMNSYNLTIENLYLLFSEEVLIVSTDVESLASNKGLQQKTLNEFNGLATAIEKEATQVPVVDVKEPVKETPVKETPVKDVPKETTKPKPVEEVKEPAKVVDKPKAPIKEVVVEPKKEVVSETTKGKTLPVMTKDSNTQLESATVIIKKDESVTVENKTDVDLETTYTKEASIEKAIDYTQKVSTTPERKAFIKRLAKSAVPVAQENGIYPSVMLAQAILESSYGGSGLSSGPNYNLFGMKGSYNGQFVAMKTLEDTGSGLYYQITAKFRKYPSYKESLEDYAKLITKGIDGSPTFYHNTLIKNTSSYTDALNALEGTYATDTRYADKLMNIIMSYNLTQYDAPDAMERILKDTVELTDVHMEARKFGEMTAELSKSTSLKAGIFLSAARESNELEYLKNFSELSPMIAKQKEVKESKDVIVEGHKYLAITQEVPLDTSKAQRLVAENDVTESARRFYDSLFLTLK